MERLTLRNIASPREAFDRALSSHSQVPGQFFLAQLLGLKVSYEDDSCIVEFDAQEFLHNPRGTLQGGVIATALDVAMGHLIQHLRGPCATIALNVQYHHAVSEGRVRCVAHVIHRGARVWSMDAAARTESAELVASATASFMLLQG